MLHFKSVSPSCFFSFNVDIQPFLGFHILESGWSHLYCDSSLESKLPLEFQKVTCSRSRLPLTDDAGAVNFQLETVNICGQGIKWKIIRSTNGPPMVHHGSIYEQLDNMLLVTQMPGWTSFRSLDDRFNILLCSIYKEGTMSVRLGPNDSGNSSMMCVFFCSWSAPMELHLLHSEWTSALCFAGKL